MTISASSGKEQQCELLFSFAFAKITTLIVTGDVRYVSLFIFSKPPEDKRRTFGMTLENVQYLTTTEFANRYNTSMAIDKDHMPLEPSFVKLLCEQGQIEHSVIPARDGRKRETLMIPEYELDKLDILLNADKAEKEKPEIKMLTSKEVAELLDVTSYYVNTLARTGKLTPTVTTLPNGHSKYLFPEDAVIKFMETYKKRTFKKGTATITDELSAKVKALEEEVKKLKESRQLISPSLSMASYADFAKAMDIIDERFRDLDKEINERTSATNEPVAKDILEAYRKGFKDGYEMGGKN